MNDNVSLRSVYARRDGTSMAQPMGVAGHREVTTRTVDGQTYTWESFVPSNPITLDADRLKAFLASSRPSA